MLRVFHRFFWIIIFLLVSFSSSSFAADNESYILDLEFYDRQNDGFWPIGHIKFFYRDRGYSKFCYHPNGSPVQVSDVLTDLSYRLGFPLDSLIIYSQYMLLNLQEKGLSRGELAKSNKAILEKIKLDNSHYLDGRAPLTIGVLFTGDKRPQPIPAVLRIYDQGNLIKVSATDFWKPDLIKKQEDEHKYIGKWLGQHQLMKNKNFAYSYCYDHRRFINIKIDINTRLLTNHCE